MLVIPLPIDVEERTQFAYRDGSHQFPQPLDQRVSRYGWELMPRFFSYIHLRPQQIGLERLLATEPFERSDVFLGILRPLDFWGSGRSPVGHAGRFSSLLIQQEATEDTVQSS